MKRAEVLRMTEAICAGIRAEAPLDAYENSYEFVNQYGLSIDNQPFDWVRYKHMVQIYEDDHPEMVLMAGAQTGKSARVIVRLVRDQVVHWGSMFGNFYPDYHLPKAFSNRRYAPMVFGNETLGPWLGKDTKQGRGQDATFTRTFGLSTMFFLSVAGKSSTEGLPLKGVYFDEVRRMSDHQIQLAEERTSAQVNPINVKVSTANYPESDIHKYFLRGDQRFFHTACRCSDGTVLSLNAPNCLMDLTHATPKLIRKVKHAFTMAGRPYLNLVGEDSEKFKDSHCAYYCVKCGDVITDPREGWWEPHAPDNYAHSYQMPQLLSPTYNASAVFRKVHRPTEKMNIQEIYNSVYGLPFLDPNKQPVRLEFLKSCVNSEAKWGAHYSRMERRKYMKNTGMGVDAQAGYLAVVIKMMAPNGKFRTVHLEVAHDKGPDGVTEDFDPWRRLAELMIEYDVSCAVIDCQPHWNEAHRFAKKFEGRVFLCYYGDNPTAPMVKWHDHGAKKDQRGDQTRFKYSLTLQRTKSLKWSLNRWKGRGNETPHPDSLTQKLPVVGGKVQLTAGLRVGTWAQMPICRHIYWEHQMCVVFRDVWEDDKSEAAAQRKREGKRKEVAEHVRLDPHFAHADNYCNFALDRIGRRARPRQV